jgi:tetratricopeptide (TPR) repeat protein
MKKTGLARPFVIILMTEIDPAFLAEEAQRAYKAREYKRAAKLFHQAAQGFALGHDELLAAEMKNNASVAHLQAGNPQQALDAALDTDKVFENAKDVKRWAIAVGNQAAALDELGRWQEALSAYEHSAQLFSAVNEKDSRALMLKSAAGVKLKRGRVSESAFEMIGALEAKANPSIFERILRFLLRFRPW